MAANSTRWGGWLAALGGIIAFGYYVPSIASWAVPLGGILAIIGGVWAVYEK